MLVLGSEGKSLTETRTFANQNSPLQGPVNPHFGHLYERPKPRHFSQRHIVTAPHEGQGNLTAASLGSIILPHQLQLGIRRVWASTDILLSSDWSSGPRRLYVFAGNRWEYAG